ncbi:hypothetical protein TIFTF001_042497 [Ficus carica]|uniref:Uncharacterized protein n=1 Tax=Ficus carica TaxID=3494 RepID=A0AA87ZNK0_FICCA|nr:hypothetical protein TIFTF001_042497 [Ficus carica]
MAQSIGVVNEPCYYKPRFGLPRRLGLRMWCPSQRLVVACGDMFHLCVCGGEIVEGVERGDGACRESNLGFCNFFEFGYWCFFS